MSRYRFAKSNEISCWIIVRLLLALSLIGIVSSCGIRTRTRALIGGKLEIKVNISPDANQNNPVAVDLLLVYNNDLFKDLLKMPASEWFAKRDQIKRDYPEDTGFESWNWEWVPGQIVELQSLPLKARAKGAVIFANYITPGAHRAVIKPHESIAINLLNEEFTVEPLNK